MEGEEEEEVGPRRGAVGHMKKRSLKNKALSVSFDNKDLQDYVTGFHKRKKKRRKEANQKLEEAHRRKLIEARKKRKLEKEFVLYGGAKPETSVGPDEGLDLAEEDDEENDPVPSVSGTMTYDNPDVKVIVTTSAISPEEDAPRERQHSDSFRSDGGDAKKIRNVPLVKKKLLKKVVKHKSRRKPQSKRDKVKGKRKSKQL